MSDLLQASSLLLAVLALIYSQWYPEINDKIDSGEEAKKNSLLGRKDAFNKVREVWINRTLPLLGSALVLAIVLIPNAVGILVSSAKMYAERGLEGLANYNAVQAIYVVAVSLTIGFCVHLSQISLRVYNLKNDLDSNNPQTVVKSAQHAPDGNYYEILVDNTEVVNKLNSTLSKCDDGTIQKITPKTNGGSTYTMTEPAYLCLCDHFRIPQNLRR